MLRSFAALLALILLAGCATQPAPLLPAFFLVQGEDIRGVPYQNETEPPVLSDYGLLVCTMTVNPDSVRARAPGATILAYLNCHEVGTWGGLYADLRAQFSMEDWWHNEDGSIASTYPNTLELLYTTDNAITLASWAAEHLAGFDGLYLDQCHSILPQWVLNLLPITSALHVEVRQDWLAYRDRLVYELNERFPETAILVANAGVGVQYLEHLPLDGITGEAHVRTDEAAWLAAAGKYDPSFCVTWCWKPEVAVARYGVSRPAYGGCAEE